MAKNRKEGRFIKTLSPYIKITGYIMRTRNDSLNMFQDSIEVTKAQHYILQKRKEGLERFGLLHLLIASYVRTICQVPAINRFVSGRRVYSRHNIEYIMTVKREMALDAEEASIKIIFDPADTAADVYAKFEEALQEVKNAPSEQNDADKIAAKLMSLPRFLLSFVVRFLEFLDYYGKLPKAILDISPFHGSFIATSMASLGIKPIFHHLYNFGNLPVFLSIGARRRAYELNRKGEVVERNYVDISAVTDERICDGFTYARAFKLVKMYMSDPELLDVPPETVIKDII